MWVRDSWACCLRDSILSSLWMIWKGHRKVLVGSQGLTLFENSPYTGAKAGCSWGYGKPYQDRNQYHPWVDRSQKHLVEKELGNPSVTIASWDMVSLGKMLVGEATRKNIQGAVPMSLGHNHTWRCHYLEHNVLCLTSGEEKEGHGWRKKARDCGCKLGVGRI